MKVALVGNPNSGKTSIFNHLTGLNQKVGNYPGITVDKKFGPLVGQKDVQILDLPGTYSIYPKSQDEEIVTQVLGDKKHEDHPDLVIMVVDITNLERNLLLYSQIHDLGLPTIIALNMMDLAERKGVNVNISKLNELFQTQGTIPLNARKGTHIDQLKEAISNFKPVESKHSPIVEGEFIDGKVNANSGEQDVWAEKRYTRIRQMLKFCLEKTDEKTSKTLRFDKLITHPILGYAFFLALLFIIFQAIYAWSEWPMDLIDSVFINLSQWTKSNLPEGVLTNLIAEGIIPGLGGVVIFIPQITLLFAFIFIMEESGYMARVVFIMDRFMRPFGLNGRSVVPLMSGVACAIPAIMATRTIDHWKERLITIMVTPLMSCSARLPVYTLLIAVVVPDTSIGFFNLKGIVLMGMYLIGILAAFLASIVFRFIIKSRQMSFLIMELPSYKIPRWNNLTFTLIEKVKVFVWEAGKVIMAISIVLWVMASYGPSDRMEKAVSQIPKPQTEEEVEQYESQVASANLANSYIGIIGHGIEPVIRPLGYNWQIGIALITSFAAREVFVGSMATIYSVGEDFEEDVSLINRMKSEINPTTGSPVYTLASGLSLMIFYAFAMQCMSTLAIVLRETKSWKWPLIQLLYMSGLAYFSALFVYQIMQP
ncbi:ferrous iron transport protein B [Marinoscillum sp. MHG1-6]|uniref:ferrous iron transport protein B n=1 Tax=Marinoscillum sp. MHG1-6 TaxID=2959627 RepID=UPI0021581F05|nr:ferrous iron transport protein B [Marinoscillum sp. MHG1-6]